MARKLQVTDLFEGARLIVKLGVREEIEDVAKRIEEGKIKTARIDMGFDLFFGIMCKATEAKAENEIYAFLSNILECTPEEVGTMDPLKLFETLEEVASIEEWINFFKRVIKAIRNLH